MNITTYQVLVDDNFDYMDASERYSAGSSSTAEEARDVARRIVDIFLSSSYLPGMTEEALLQQYKSFGDDPFISPADPSCPFSAWKYAAERCKEICA